MLVRQLRVQPGDRYIIPGDIHADKQDNAALGLMTEVMFAEGCNGAILIGDTFESAGLSHHGRPASKFRMGAGTIASERRAIAPWLTTWKRLVRKRRKKGGLHVLTGNHEKWWEDVQEVFPGLMDTPWFELYGDIFDGWHIHKEHTSLKLGPLLVCHGHRLRGALSRNTASAVLANYPGQNTLYGHTHRVSVDITPSWKYGMHVEHGAFSIGHMKDLLEEAKDSFLGPHSERHRQGFALVEFFEVAGELRFNVDVVPIGRGRNHKPYCFVRGGLYAD